ncbi:hypothetical protein NARC_50200 [Candidatus Nitrosocosmicus arcticus]|uniref:Uncharacterized protein n=1 Tax=Candidatus Nitrosocosmicus arcticus TaxID=2035267 RepID=A0A557SWN7_9ARCH|nr:hypothetical protein NARC_50200 [Candidatus Nitrosocosmicus arcticus]
MVLSSLNGTYRKLGSFYTMGNSRNSRSQSALSKASISTLSGQKKIWFNKYFILEVNLNRTKIVLDMKEETLDYRICNRFVEYTKI